MFMTQIERHLDIARARFAKKSGFIEELDRVFASPGRTIGIRPSADLRDRIDAIREKHKYPSLKRTVLACTLLGVRVLEEVEPNADPV